MIAIGLLSLFLTVHLKLKNTIGREEEETYIFPKIVISGLVGYFSAAVFDALVKIRENGKFQFRGIAFYGGLLGVITVMFFLLKFSRKNSAYGVREWFDFLTAPLLIFHFFGRIGCFLAGCCYGKTTSSILGVHFPDNLKNGIFHYGQKCYPTQLFEAMALLVILIIIWKIKRKFLTYMICYAVARFVIECFRGDDRGYLIQGISPSQMVAIFVIVICVFYAMAERYINKKAGNRERVVKL